MAARARCPAHPLRTANRPAAAGPCPWSVVDLAVASAPLATLVLFCIALWLPASGQCQFSIWIVADVGVPAVSVSVRGLWWGLQMWAEGEGELDSGNKKQSV